MGLFCNVIIKLQQNNLNLMFIVLLTQAYSFFVLFDSTSCSVFNENIPYLLVIYVFIVTVVTNT